jgi:inosose dehydratase
MTKAKLAYAIWPWGLKEEAQMIQGMEDIKAAGFRYFESVATAVDMFKGRTKEFKAIMDQHQVYPVSFYFWNRGDLKNDVAVVEHSLDFLAANKIKRMNIQAAGKKGGGATPEELRLTLDTVQAIGKAAKPYGILPCIHPHANTMVMFENEIDFIMQNTDPAEVGFGPDTAHLTVGRCDPVAITRRYANRVGFTHLKDVRKNKTVEGDAGKNEGFEVFSSFLELGQGEVDIPGFLKVLEDVGYDGYLAIELDKAPVSNKESTAANMKYMQKFGY